MKEKSAFYTAILATVFCPCCALPTYLSILVSTGVISGVEWLEQLRPLFIVIAFASVIYLWYSYFQHKKHAGACCSKEKENYNFFHNKYFLFGLTSCIVMVNVFSLVG